MKFGKRDHDSMEIDQAECAVHDVSQSILRKVVGDSNLAESTKSLTFCMLGCEPKPPYGPNHHTAELFLDLIGQAAVASHPDKLHALSIHVYNVQEDEYPENWDAFDGILLPGSFASAYDTDPWILKLSQVLQDQVVARNKPTLGICFGHQLLAHSFANGKAVKTPAGPRGGRYIMSTTATGRRLLGSDKVGLYYTHGDMVAALPKTAVSLGGDSHVPIQAAAYYATEAEAALVQNSDSSLQSSLLSVFPLPRPYAVTFQAHPEFATSRDLGMYRTLELILDAMGRRGDFPKEVRLAAGQDAQEHFESVQQDSVHVMQSAGRLLGWF